MVAGSAGDAAGIGGWCRTRTPVMVELIFVLCVSTETVVGFDVSVRLLNTNTVDCSKRRSIPIRVLDGT